MRDIKPGGVGGATRTIASEVDRDTVHRGVREDSSLKQPRLQQPQQQHRTL